MTVPKLTIRELNTLRWAYRETVAHNCIGRRRIVTMQALEKLGLARRVTVNGMIADWTLTPAGLAWPAQPPPAPHDAASPGGAG